MSDPQSGQLEEQIALPRGYYYWDGRSLRRIEAADGQDGGDTNGMEGKGGQKSQVAAAVETLALCSVCSILIAALTQSMNWDAGALAGLSHAFSLFPILLIDPVYRRVISGQIDIRLAASHTALRFRRSRATHAPQPWWLRATFYITLVIVCLEVIGFLSGRVGLNKVGAMWVSFYMLLVPIGFAIRLAPRHGRIATLILVAAMSIPAMALIDPFLSSLPGLGHLFPADLAGSGSIRYAIENVITGLFLSPGAVAFALTGYGLSSLEIHARRPPTARAIDYSLGAPLSEWDGQRWLSHDRQWQWDGQRWLPMTPSVKSDEGDIGVLPPH